MRTGVCSGALPATLSEQACGDCESVREPVCRLQTLPSAGEPGVRSKTGSSPHLLLIMAVWVGHFLSLAASTACAQHVDAARIGRPLQCRPVGQTPIYDQLRREQTSTHAPVTSADPHQANHRGKHRLLTDGPDALAACHHDLGCPYPADGKQRGAVVWGPQAVLPPEAHAQHAPTTLPTTSPPDACGFGCQGTRSECGAANTTHTRITDAGPRAVLADRDVLSLHLEMITARSEHARAARPSSHRHERTTRGRRGC